MSSYNDVKVLVTGATGFLGSHAVGALLGRGAVVHAMVRPHASLDRIAPFRSRIEVHHGDLRDYALLVECIERSQPDIILHLAGDVSARRSMGGWENVRQSIEVNLIGTMSLIQAAIESGRNLRSLVRVGGLEEYGRARIPFVETMREEPISAYSAAQVAATHFSQALQPAIPFRLVTVRPALLFGPAQSRAFFIPQVIEACLAGTDFEMTSGTQSRDLLYVDDAVEGILAAAINEDLRGTVINLATGTEHSIAEVADLIVQLTGAKIQLRRGAQQSGAADLQHLVGSADLAQKLLGWRARTSLEEGLKRTISYYAASMSSRIPGKTH